METDVCVDESDRTNVPQRVFTLLRMRRSVESRKIIRERREAVLPSVLREGMTIPSAVAQK